MPRSSPCAHRSRRPYAVGLLSLLTLTLCACANTLPPRGTVAMREVNLPLHDLRLPSGFRVVVEEDHHAPVVAVVAVVGSGGSNDPAGKEGLAHLVEHLSFRSRQAGGPSATLRLEQLGVGSHNARTSLDHTRYEFLLPREALPELLKLEAQRLTSPLEGVTQEVLAVEREVARNELRERTETGHIGQIFHWVQATSFPAGHPYARPILGTHESLSSITLADAQRFASEHYKPENMTLVITGDVDLETVSALLKENLPQAWQGSGPPMAVSERLQQPAPAPPLAPAAPMLTVYKAAVPTPELYLTWVLPRGFDEAGLAQGFVRANLDYHLFHTGRNEEDITDIDTNLISGTRASLLIMRVALKKGERPERTAERLLTHVHALWERQSDSVRLRVGDLHFQRMLRTAVVGMALEAEDPLARAVARAELTHFSQDIRTYGRMRTAAAELKRPQLTGFARQWLQRDRVRSFLVLPGESDAKGPRPTLAWLADEEAASAPAPQRPPASALTRSEPITSLRLDNGVQVLLVPRPGVGLVTIGVALGGGEASSKRSGIAEYAERVSYPRSAYQGEPGDYGLQHSSQLHADHLRYTLAGATGNIGNMLAILGEQLTMMGTDFIMMGMYEQYVLLGRLLAEFQPEEQVERAMAKALYGTHPYGHSATVAELARVTRDDLEEWLDQVHTPSNALVVIAGEFEPQQVIPLVRQHLGSWDDQGQPVTVPALPPLTKSSRQLKLFIAPRPGVPQGQVQVACRLPETTPEAAARYALMASVIQARLWRQVREKMGATYGFQARYWMARGGAAHLKLEGAVDGQHLATSLIEIRDALTSYAQTGVPTAELEAARGRLLAEHAVSFTTSGAWVHALLNTGVLGWEPDALTRRPTLLQVVTPEALRQEFAGCIERLAVGIIGDEAQARSALDAAFP